MFKKLVVPLIFTNLEFLFFMNNKGRGVGGVALKREAWSAHCGERFYEFL